MQEELKAFIDEENCIGCSKCIRTCPTDAIVGSKHVLHTILPKICTSCGHCVDACPTNCITISQLGQKLDEDTELKLTQQKQLRLNGRLGREPNLFVPSQISVPSNDAAQQRKQSVLDAIARVKAKKNLAN